MKGIMVYLFFVIVMLVTGCESDDTETEELKKLEDRIVELEGTVKEQQKKLAKQNNDFSYLDGLTEEELDAYKQFDQSKDTKHLSSFSPEKIFLVYFQSVVLDDVEAIYALTYDNGTLPDLSTFRQTYYQSGLDKQEMEIAFEYRYYDSLGIKEDSESESEVVVEIGANFEQYQSITYYGLKKDNEIWKMDIFHLFDE